MLNSVTENGHRFDECKKILRESECAPLPAQHHPINTTKDIALDPGFREFHAWCKAKDIPVIIVSRCVCSFVQDLLTDQVPLPSGMAPIIRAVLSNLVPEEDANEIDIIANDAIVQPDGKWEIQFRHPSRYA